jgi:hypothetical protein
MVITVGCKCAFGNRLQYLPHPSAGWQKVLVNPAPPLQPASALGRKSKLASLTPPASRSTSKRVSHTTNHTPSWGSCMGSTRRGAPQACRKSPASGTRIGRCIRRGFVEADARDGIMVMYLVFFQRSFGCDFTKHGCFQYSNQPRPTMSEARHAFLQMACRPLVISHRRCTLRVGDYQLRGAQIGREEQCWDGSRRRAGTAHPQSLCMQAVWGPRGKGGRATAASNHPIQQP